MLFCVTLKILHAIIMLVCILSCVLGLREIQHFTNIICCMFCTVYRIFFHAY